LTVYVHGWGVPGGSSPFVLHEWSVPGTEEGNMRVSALSLAELGDSGTIDLSFFGLEPDTRYLGSVAYSGDSEMPTPTIVAVHTRWTLPRRNQPARGGRAS
jgi:hypothetical protein